MRKKTLYNELRHLKYYLKKIDNSNYQIDSNEAKVISHTLIGMIMTIHNLAKTGAYNNYDGSKKEIYTLIEEARNRAVHYGFFNNIEDIKKEAKIIMSQSHDDKDTNYFAPILLSKEFENTNYYQIENNSKTEISQTSVPEDFYKFRAYKSTKTIFVKKEDVIVLKNKLNDSVSYLLKESDEANIYIKDGDNETEKISFNTLLKEGFFKPFTIANKGNKLTKSLNKIISDFGNDPYKNIVIGYKYNNKMYNITAHNLFIDFLFNHQIDEKIAFGHFCIMDYDTPRNSETENLEVITKDLVENATLLDLFYIELFMKRYKIYTDLKEASEEFDSDNANYTKQSLLVNLFEIGASSLSESFLKSDRSGSLMSFYHEYRKTRNELAHFVSSKQKDRNMLIENLENYSTDLYKVFSKVYNDYYSEKRSRPFSKFPSSITKDENGYTVTNKTYQYYQIPHCSISKLIDGKKYLKIRDERKNLYVEVDNEIYSLNYNTKVSDVCLVPTHSRFVTIDNNSNKIQSAHYNPDDNQIINIDPFISSLLQAYDHCKTHPQYKKNPSVPNFCAITYYDKFGTPYCCEGLSNLIYRRYCQKAIPQQLVDAHILSIPKDINEPIEILNKNKQIVAKVYYACINNNETVSQILKDGTLRNIDSGKLLPKNLKTDQLIQVIKEGRR